MKTGMLNTETDTASLSELAREIKIIRTQLDNIEKTISEWNRERIEAQKNPPFSQRIKNRIRLFIQPRLGVLYQYDGRPLVIPKHYKKNPRLKKFPSITIVTPSFNQGEFIERTLRSVLDQQYPRLEYIVQDGGSSDATTSILSRYQSSLTTWRSEPDKGQSQAINKGFVNTTGDIMAYLNSDDILLPGSLHTIADFFEKNPKVDVVYGHRVLINPCDEEIGRWVLPPHKNDILTWADYIPQETLFWRRSLWNKIGGTIDESFRFAMDWDLILRFMDAGAQFARLPRFLGAFRIHANQKTSSVISDIGLQEMTRLRTRYHGPCVTHRKINAHLRPYLRKHWIFHQLYRLGLLRY